MVIVRVEVERLIENVVHKGLMDVFIERLRNKIVQIMYIHGNVNDRMDEPLIIVE